MHNCCLIDWLRFSIPNSDFLTVADNILGIPSSLFDSEKKSSPFPTYDAKRSFANIEIHSSSKHENILVNLSGKGCRQYEEYMSHTDEWHWQAFIKTIISHNAKITRIDLALDIFDEITPDISKLQDYIKRGQLCSRAQTYKFINSGKILDGTMNGFTIYIGAHPQILRIYDKKQEVRENTGEILNIAKWIRWELELGDSKAHQASMHIANGDPLSIVIKGILASHYSFKTQQKGKKDFHNKHRWRNMKWWDIFLQDIPAIKLRVIKSKTTLKDKKEWLKNSTTKTRAMLYEYHSQAFSEDYANAYLREEIIYGKSKITDLDRSMIIQAVNEAKGELEI